jgi:hypothetical protein
MRIIGISFNKMLAERFNKKVEELKIGNEINIKNIKEIDSGSVKIKENLLEVEFYYNVLYEPNLAKISFEGTLLIAVESKEAKDILKDWKNKNLDESIKLNFFNIILRKISLRALQLEEELNLPPHFNLPFLKLDKEDKKDKK